MPGSTSSIDVVQLGGRLVDDALDGQVTLGVVRRGGADRARDPAQPVHHGRRDARPGRGRRGGNAQGQPLSGEPGMCAVQAHPQVGRGGGVDGEALQQRPARSRAG
jgi:hypothetical protein